MKSFVVTLLLLCGMLALILLNSLYVNHATDHLLELLDTLSSPEDETCAQQVTRLLEEWQRVERIIDLSANRMSIDRVERELTLLNQAARANNSYEFSAARALLRDALCDIRQFEKILFSQIL